MGKRGAWKIIGQIVRLILLGATGVFCVVAALSMLHNYTYWIKGPFIRGEGDFVEWGEYLERNPAIYFGVAEPLREEEALSVPYMESKAVYFNYTLKRTFEDEDTDDELLEAKNGSIPFLMKVGDRLFSLLEDNIRDEDLETYYSAFDDLLVAVDYIPAGGEVNVMAQKRGNQLLPVDKTVPYIFTRNVGYYRSAFLLYTGFFSVLLLLALIFFIYNLVMLITYHYHSRQK